MSDQDRISPHNIKQTSDENKEKYKLRENELIQRQILQTNVMRTVWQIVRRITNEILGVKGLTSQFALCRNTSNILSEKESDIIEYVFDNTGKFNMMFSLKPDILLEKKYFTWSM